MSLVKKYPAPAIVVHTEALSGLVRLSAGRGYYLSEWCG